VSRLTDLIARAKAKDPELGADLDREFKVLSSRLPFGLNFERHRPEAVELPLRPIRKGDKVRVLPERGSTKKGDQRLWQVKNIHKANKLADLELLGGAEIETQSIALVDLTVVAEFRDTIYPGLVSTGKVERGGEKPFHTVINGENYHALKALTYTHRGKVDAIYIDPPYNTGAKDWKYNNDYVEGDDLYRHSKWLAMMERRLLVAKELLNPADSVLIVTIDEKEYLRLGLLLEQTYPQANIQMTTIVINPLGQERSRKLARVEEYAFFCFFGNASPKPMIDDLLNRTEIMKGHKSDRSTEKVRWERLLRGGSEASRQKSPDLFYPVFIDPIRHRVHSVGEPISLDVSRDSVSAPEGTVTVWPMRTNGQEGRWRCSAAYFRELLTKGYARVGEYDRANDRWSLLYLGKAQIRRVESGEIEVFGRNDDGSILLGRSEQKKQMFSVKTVWNRPSHRSGEYGTSLNRLLVPGRRFPYPKALYAVEDALRIVVADKPQAIVLDFFSGSGTTAHAVMRLNRQDGGSRQCISVTNNEVAADEQKSLRERGLRPGDPDWEKHGICDYITKPRVEAAITGKTPDGEPIKGEYKFTDVFPMAEGFEENAEFFTLTYEAKDAVNHNLAYSRIAPLLWLRAGARGSRIDKLPADGLAVADTYGLLVEVDKSAQFIKAVGKAKGVHIVYIVTDDDRRFQAIAKRLPDAVEPVRLYESFLTNFSFANGE
jgi:adenine-specific DNA-methyltransferase